ncbi:AraC family transcriptional regulator [Cellvibrio sp. UBA7661]|uniref:helix-turn-helix domain-containing protein n=1 Tax=Cellvibrio sp. UBA7661 TaxID=1946311 RepID=UPI002F35A36D
MTTPIFNLNDIILILAIGLSLVLALFQLLLPARKKVSRILLTTFFLSIALSDVGIMLIWNEYIPQTSLTAKLVPYFYSGSLLLKAPLLIFYVRSITEENFRFKRIHLLHLLPTLVAVAIIAIFDIDINRLKLDTFGIDAALYTVIDCLWYSLKIIPLAYFIAATVTVWRYHKVLRQQHSNVNETALWWLYYLTLGFVLAGVWTLTLSLLAYFYRLPLGVTDNYLNFVLLIALFYYSISHAQNLTTTKEDEEFELPKEVTPEAGTKPLDSTIDKIMDGIVNQKLYLNQSLNVEQFSAKIGVPYRDVSYAINKTFGTNFFEFINSYRIEESKRYLADEKYKDMTIMDILLESGFNSKSAFQRFFKRLTGTSPTEFRREALRTAYFTNDKTTNMPKE